MAALLWPATLPACAESWEEVAEPVTVRTQMESGPPKVRRRFTRTLRSVRVQFTVNHTQAMALRTFFEVDTQGGVLEHEFRHPFRNTVESFRFVEAPRIANMGALACSISCSWEQL